MSIAIGSSGKNVENLQKQLKQLGYYSEVIDGNFDPCTERAVKDFQSDYNLTLDGIVGNQTKATLEQVIFSTTILKNGKTSNEVKTLKRQLQQLSYYAGSINSIFNAETESCVKNFQKENRLPIDGIVGNTMRSALSALLLKSEPPNKPDNNPNPPLKNFSSNYNPTQAEYIITKQLIQQNRYTRRERQVSTRNPLDSIKAIVVHWVGNPNTAAQVNRNYFNNQTNYASAHYIVGLNGEVIQCVPDEQCAFHAGGAPYSTLAKTRFIDTNGVMKHNDWTIGIESCHLDWKGRYSSKTYTTFVRLTADLLKKYNLSVATGLLRHYDMTGKDCPKLLCGENNPEWEKFKLDVTLAMSRVY